MKDAASGGAVIVSADGSRLEIQPSQRTRTSLAERAFRAIPQVELPVLDDPSASLAQRKSRAEGLMIASVLVAFGLVFWARRYKSGVH